MTEAVFTPEQRDRVRRYLLHEAGSDPRVVAGAAVGSDALGRGDRWSDLDLTFGLAEGVTMKAVMDDWTGRLAQEFGAVHLFDVRDRTTEYRVFLLPGNLQVDLSFTPGSVAEYGPRFKLLFGTQVKREYSSPTTAREIFGIGVHHTVRARFSIERHRPWQAEYWISGVRDQALLLACHRRGLEGSHGRGFDQLPEEVLHSAGEGLVRSLERAELLRALRVSTELLLREAEEVRDVAAQLERQLHDLGSPGWP